MPALITVAVTRFNLTASVSAFRRSVAAFLNAFCSIQRHACNVLHGCTCGKTSHSGPRGCTTVLRTKRHFAAFAQESAFVRFADLHLGMHTLCTKTVVPTLIRTDGLTTPSSARTRVKDSNTKPRKMLTSSSFDDPPYDVQITERLS